MCIVGSCQLLRASSCTPLNIPNEEEIHYQENLSANVAYHPISKYGKIGVKQTWQPLPRYHLAISSQKWLFFHFLFIFFYKAITQFKIESFAEQNAQFLLQNCISIRKLYKAVRLHQGGKIPHKRG